MSMLLPTTRRLETGRFLELPLYMVPMGMLSGAHRKQFRLGVNSRNDLYKLVPDPHQTTVLPSHAKQSKRQWDETREHIVIEDMEDNKAANKMEATVAIAGSTSNNRNKTRNSPPFVQSK